MARNLWLGVGLRVGGGITTARMHHRGAEGKRRVWMRGRWKGCSCCLCCTLWVSVSFYPFSSPICALYLGVGVRQSLLGPCSLLMVALDASTSNTHTHTNTAHTRTDNKRGSGGHHAQGHRPRIQTHRRRSRAACDRMRQLPVSQKTNDVSWRAVIAGETTPTRSARVGRHAVVDSQSR
jgi:hypothetical protein